MLRLASVVACLLACTPNEPPATAAASAPSPPPDAPSPACAARVTAMRTLFARGTNDRSFIQPPDGMRLPTSSGGIAVGDGLPVFLREDGSFVFDARPHDLDALEAALLEEFDRARQMAENTGAPMTGRLLLVADARAPVARVRELAAFLPPDVKPALIVDLEGDEIPTPPPTPAPVRAALDVRDPAARVGKIAALIDPAVGGCKPIQDVFRAVADATADTREKILFDGLPGALEQCRCEGVDVETLVSVVWSMSGKTEHSRRQLELPLLRDPKAEPVTLPANATIGDLVPALVSRGDKPFRLEPK